MIEGYAMAVAVVANPRSVRRAFASVPAARAVLAILRGVPPAKVAADASVDEATLYAWREAFMMAGAQALG